MDDVARRPGSGNAVAPTEGEEALRVLWELSIAAAGIGTFDWDLTTGRLRWDDRLVEQFGYDRATFDETLEAFTVRVHPDERARVAEELRACVEDGADLAMEYRIVLPSGQVRWISAKGRPLRGASGACERLLGATLDVTGTRAGEAAVTAVLEAMSAAFFSLDRSWRFTYVNAEAEALLQRSRTELVGGGIWELFPAAPGSDFEANYRRAMDGDELVTFQAHYPAPLDAWYEVRALPTAEGLSVFFLDITERRRAERAAADAAQRAELVAAVTSELAEHLDAEEAVARLADLVVPTLADWCMVTLVDDDDAQSTRPRDLRDVGFAHTDPALRPVLASYADHRMGALLDRSFIARALLSQQPILVEEDATPRILQGLAPGRAQELLTTLAPTSAAVLPLRGRGRTVGLLTLSRGAGRDPITPQELVTAGEVAGRAGLALDNARLYRQQRDLAEGLQRSLLTAPPEPEHTQIVVRYSAAARAAQVGGDWYDAFVQPDGATVLVIGDVVGHDTQAAAAMSQVRTLLRGLGVEDGAGPAELLRKVDRVMETLRLGTTATAIVARIEQTDDEVSRGVTHLRWSNAGHPPAMVVNPDGTVLPLVAASSDLLLGVLPSTRRHEHEVTLDRGATVLLYTDGLVERRRQSLDVGLGLLQDLLAELAARDLDLDALCDEVLARMLPTHPEDDVALVAVRLLRQDRDQDRA